MTRVWPALCPPWKRTTMSACSDNQSTIFPLPSSPHWEPTTTTFAMKILPARRRAARRRDNRGELTGIMGGFHPCWLEFQWFCLLDLRQCLHLLQHLGRELSIDLDQRHGIPTRRFAADVEG